MAGAAPPPPSGSRRRAPARNSALGADAAMASADGRSRRPARRISSRAPDDLDADRALRRRRQPDRAGRRPRCPSRSSPAAARIVASTSPRSTLASRVCDVAADRHDLEVGPAGEQLRGRAAARRCRPGRPRGSASRLSAPISRSRVSARGSIAAMASAVGPDRLDVLHRMDRHVGAPVEQAGVELLGPQRLAADLGERPVLDHVAASW